MKPFILALLLFSPFFCHANQYDKDEETKRAAQKLVDMDKREREAAKERYDREHPSSSGGSGASGLLCILIIPLVAFGFYQGMKEKT